MGDIMSDHMGPKGEWVEKPRAGASPFRGPRDEPIPHDPVISRFNSVQDSGTRQEFSTGARRDAQDDKPLYALIPAGPLYRLAMHYTNGAKKYGPNNWTKGIPMSRCLESLQRHVEAFRLGDESEDHLAAIAWNAFALMWYQDTMPDMNDLDEYLARLPRQSAPINDHPNPVSPDLEP